MNISDHIVDLWFTSPAYRDTCLLKAGYIHGKGGTYDYYPRASDMEAWFDSWNARGRTENPPELLKHMTLEAYRMLAYPHIDILVETGACKGSAAYYNRFNFEKIYTVELDTELYSGAKKLLDPFPNIDIRHGDSKQVLPQFLEQIDEPCIFWLDSNHRITLRRELETVFANSIKEHVILIDDYRLFGNLITSILPDEIKSMAESNGYNFAVQYDSMRLTPK
jgi:hypothetical protein